VRERYLGTFHEGPTAPSRLHAMVIAYANLHPRATREEWVRFAAAHAQEAYRSGYARGFEWAERQTSHVPNPPPEILADQLDPDWRWSPPFAQELSDPGDEPLPPDPHHGEVLPRLRETKGPPPGWY
jgi:hypothetical protein